MKTIVLSGALLGIASFGASAADSPWAGHWKLDTAQSHFTGNTFTYTQGPHGQIHYSDGSTIGYDFGLDGKEYPAAYNRTTSWSPAGKNAWNQVTKADGKVLSRSHRVLSPDGKTLTLTFTGEEPNGQPFNEEEVYTRVAGGQGLIGKWRSVKVPENAPESFVISSPSPGSLHFDMPEQKASAEGAADGTDHPLNGPNMPPGMTVGFKMSGNQIHYTLKVDGKPDTYGIETLAADGKSFADVSWAPGKESEKQTAVYVKR